MKILFIAPPLDVKTRKKVSPRHPPYILASAAAILEKENFTVRIYDAFAEHASIEDVLRVTEEYNPYLIGVAGAELDREIFVESIETIINSLSNRFPKLPIILIGISNSVVLLEIIKKTNTCYSILGDPEEVILQIAQCVNENKNADLYKIPGLVVKRNGKIITVGTRRVNINLDLLPFPAWHLIDFKKYPITPHRYSLSYPYVIIASRGCPWNRCVFCEHISLFRAPEYRIRSPKNVASEIDFAIKRYDAKEIRFEDANFNTDIKWLADFRDTLKKYSINIPWSCLTRIDRVNLEILKLMHDAGCWSIVFGIESSSQRLLDIINKGYYINQIDKVIKWCKETGIETVGSFLIGLPTEIPDNIMDSVKFAKNIGIDYAQFFIAKWHNMPEGFKMYGKFAVERDYHPLDHRGYPFIPHAYKDLNHLRKIWRIAYCRFYFSPRVILRHLQKINSFEKFKRALLAVLVLVKISVKR